MTKMAYVSVTFLYSFEPKELNLDDGCTEDEFRDAVEDKMKEEEMIMPYPFDDIEIIIDDDTEIFINS